MDSLQQSSNANPAAPTPTTPAEDLAAALRTEPEKKRLPLIAQLIACGDPGITQLLRFLQEHSDQGLLLDGPTPRPNLVLGKAYQALFESGSPAAHEFLQAQLPTGLIPLQSDLQVDYTELQVLLAKQDFQAADKLTSQKLCELAGEGAIARNWVYFTEVKQFPATDLRTLDHLWLIHTEGKFSFSVQREIWLSLGKNWDKFWPKIQWKSGNAWTRYPGEFQWDLAAPRGHLPLSNQLRGVRVMEALLTHPVWTAQS